MKALLDILNEEKIIVRQVNRLNSDIESRSEYYNHIRRTFSDCEAKERDLEGLIIEIDILKTERSKQEVALRDIQHELAKYLEYLNTLL